MKNWSIVDLPCCANLCYTAKWLSFTHIYILFLNILFHYGFSSVTRSCPTLCDPIDFSTPGFPVHHQLPQPTQTHVHCVSDAIQPHPLSSPSPLAFNLSQHQGLFQWVGSLHKVAKVLQFQLQYQSFQRIFRTDFLSEGLVWSCIPRNSQESSPRPQFKSMNSLAFSFLLLSNSHIHTWLLEKS